MNPDKDKIWQEIAENKLSVLTFPSEDTVKDLLTSIGFNSSNIQTTGCQPNLKLADSLVAAIIAQADQNHAVYLGLMAVLYSQGKTPEVPADEVIDRLCGFKVENRQTISRALQLAGVNVRFLTDERNVINSPQGTLVIIDGNNYRIPREYFIKICQLIIDNRKAADAILIITTENDNHNSSNQIPDQTTDTLVTVKLSDDAVPDRYFEEINLIPTLSGNYLPGKEAKPFSITSVEAGSDNNNDWLDARNLAPISEVPIIIEVPIDLNSIENNPVLDLSGNYCCNMGALQQ